MYFMVLRAKLLDRKIVNSDELHTVVDESFGRGQFEVTEVCLELSAPEARVARLENDTSSSGCAVLDDEVLVDG